MVWKCRDSWKISATGKPSWDLVKTIQAAIYFDAPMTVVGRLNSSDKLWFAHTLKKRVTLVLWVRQFIFYFASNFSPRPWNPFKLLVLTNPLHVHDLCKIARFYLFIYALFMPFLLLVIMQFLPMYPFEYNASYHCF